MSTNYNKLNKDQLINLLKQRDEQLNEMNRRIEVIEKKLSESELERNGYKLEQYGRCECIEIIGLPEMMNELQNSKLL